MQTKVKNCIIKIKIFDSEDTNPNDGEQNIDKKDKDNINLPTTDIYSYTVIITHICQREQDTTNFLEFLLLSYLHYSLGILDKVTIMITYTICYYLNLFHSNFKISEELVVNNEISTTITNVWKDVYETVLIKTQTRANNELNNYLDFVYSHIIPTRLLE